MPMLGAGSPSTQAASALSPAATPRTGGTIAVPAKPLLHSAVSDAAALAAAARLQCLPTHAGDALAGAMAGGALTEAQKQLLAAVDVDYLHSFRCCCRHSCCIVLPAADASSSACSYAELSQASTPATLMLFDRSCEAPFTPAQLLLLGCPDL